MPPLLRFPKFGLNRFLNSGLFRLLGFWVVVDGVVVDSDETADEAAAVSLLFSGELVDSDAGRVWSLFGFSEVALLA